MQLTAHFQVLLPWFELLVPQHIHIKYEKVKRLYIRSILPSQLNVRFVNQSGFSKVIAVSSLSIIFYMTKKLPLLFLLLSPFFGKHHQQTYTGLYFPPCAVLLCQFSLRIPRLLLPFEMARVQQTVSFSKTKTLALLLSGDHKSSVDN